MIPRNWPKWTLFIIAMVLVVAIIGVALLLEPIGLALAPTPSPEPPSLPSIDYARPLSQECEACHFDLAALEASGASAEEIGALLIDSASLDQPHGSLGCVTCHSGTGGESDKDAAHAGMVENLRDVQSEDCVLCHRDLPDQLPEDGLRTPHGEINNAVWEGSACGVPCTDCHGQVGHGPDPVTDEGSCSMTVCLDCHEGNDVEDSLSDCVTCHIELHELPEDYACRDCHTTTDTWQETLLTEHPEELTDEHSTLDCFTCHRWPGFSGLEYGCSDCHERPQERPHDVSSDDCQLCHTSVGWTDSADLTVAKAMSFPHPAEGKQECLECHEIGETYAMPDEHAGRINDDCETCHVSEPSPLVMHPLEERDYCLDCHDVDGVALYPYPGHKDYEVELCTACHAPSDSEPPAVPHDMEGRMECLFCHGPIRIMPFPADHNGRANEMCLLCHDAEEAPTRSEHLFPLTHNGAAENCETCHPGLDFTAYTCQACHIQETVDTIHLERGIKLEEDCMICHPVGEKPLND